MPDTSEDRKIERGDRQIYWLKRGSHATFAVAIVCNIYGPLNPDINTSASVIEGIFLGVCLIFEILAAWREKQISRLREQRQNKKDQAHAAETKSLRSEIAATSKTLEESKAGRYVDLEMRKKIKEVLSKYIAQKQDYIVRVYVKDAEALGFAADIDETLRDCGWEGESDPTFNNPDFDRGVSMS